MEKLSFKSKRARSIFAITVWALIFTWCALFLYVLAWGLMTSGKSDMQFTYNKLGFPKPITNKLGVVRDPGKFQFLENYAFVFESMTAPDSNGARVSFFPMLFNTLYYTLAYGLAAVVSPMLCSYIYAKYSKRVRWTKLVWVIMLVNMYVPLSASLASSINLAMQLGTYNNIFTFIWTYCGGFGGCFLIYYAIWKGLSWDYAEAAIIDGANHFTILFKIMFPMTLTVFWVLYITQIIALWSDYQVPMVYLSDYPTLAYGVFVFNSTVGAAGASGLDPTSVTIKLAALFIVATPMFTLFMIFKDKMMGSLTMGGLKG